ncbi:hypothetical protein HLH34_04300 [Gluconacetobacter azotocaptans]|uniref:CI repressor n=1 Tax=Gluconacetobacter azotocaptans TaxID=142834 RepID=A0A7W4JR35_9PROT|nr:hypothetical protein [Gluconacetobacter azotocaptans]
MNETVRRVIDAAGGPTALARHLGIKIPSLYSWRRIPAERVNAVHAVTGIPREDLRPDLFAPGQYPVDSSRASKSLARREIAA